MPSKVHLLIQEEHLEEFQQNLFVFLRSCVRRDHHNKSFPPPFFFLFIMPDSVVHSELTLPEDSSTRSLELPTPLTLNQPDE